MIRKITKKECKKAFAENGKVFPLANMMANTRAGQIMFETFVRIYRNGKYYLLMYRDEYAISDMFDIDKVFLRFSKKAFLPSLASSVI